MGWGVEGCHGPYPAERGIQPPLLWFSPKSSCSICRASSCRISARARKRRGTSLNSALEDLPLDSLSSQPPEGSKGRSAYMSVSGRATHLFNCRGS